MPAFDAAMMLSPTVTKSGLTRPSCHVGPRELNAATSSSPRLTVPFVMTAPTVSADLALAGEVIPADPTFPVAGLIP